VLFCTSLIGASFCIIISVNRGKRGILFKCVSFIIYFVTISKFDFSKDPAVDMLCLPFHMYSCSSCTAPCTVLFSWFCKTLQWRFVYRMWNSLAILLKGGHGVAQLVEALRNELKGLGFDSRLSVSLT
jgi:hypothetical protein